MVENKKVLQAGFTLIELSIVLVIIGLIVGGVLVGRDLIKAAEVRATVTQLEKYNTATNTFRNKYGGLPGDLVSTQASAFGLYYLTLGGGAGGGDGNGIVLANTTYPNCFGGELSVFFLHLSQSGLIDGMYGVGGSTTSINGATNAGGSGNGGNANTTTQISDVLPPAKMGNNNYFIVITDGAANYFALSGITVLQGAGRSDFGSSNNITPNDAYNIDKKIDDGFPATGKTFALNVTGAGSNLGGCTLASATTAASNACVSGANYNTSGTAGTTMSCGLRFNFQ